MIELVVFDIAGTTVRDGDEVAASMLATLAEVGAVPSHDQLRDVMGLPKPQALRVLLAGVGHPAGDAEIAHLHREFQRHMREHYAQHPEVAEIPGAGAVFAELRRSGIRAALNTGFDRSIVDVLLRRLGWAVPEVVDAVVTSDEVERGRPYPDMILKLMGFFGISDPARVAKVGDTWADLEEGTQAGCGLVIGVLTGSYGREQLMQKQHTHIVESIREVPGLVAR